MRSLRWKLGSVLLLIVAISVGLMAYLTNLSTEREFDQYVTQGNQRYINSVSDALGLGYAREGNWGFLQFLLPDLLRSTGDRLVIADNSGVIVGDTGKHWLGKTLADVGLSNGASINVSREKVGELYVFLTQPGGGGGYFGSERGGPPAAAPAAPAVDTPEQEFLDRVNRSLLVAGLITATVAVIIGLLFTRQLTRPIKALVSGAGQIASGNLGYRVDIRSEDEFGTLGESFNAMATSLSQVEEERKRIVADIAHELRTPLTVIEGTITAIEDGVFAPDRERLAAVREQTSLLTRLTSDLRDLSLAESGQLKLTLVPTDLIDLVRRKVSQFEMPAKQKGLHLTADLPDQAPKANVDPARIEQVLANLITNAIRHTASGSVRVSLRAVKSDRHNQVDSPSLIVSVADTGEGISPESLPYVFERFYRVETSRARSEGGAGLGLAIVKQVVQAHQGKVWAEGEPGKGSTFYIALPQVSA